MIKTTVTVPFNTKMPNKGDIGYFKKLDIPALITSVLYHFKREIPDSNHTVDDISNISVTEDLTDPRNIIVSCMVKVSIDYPTQYSKP